MFQAFVVTPKGAASDRITILEPRVESQTAAMTVLKAQKFQSYWGIVLQGNAGQLMSLAQQLDSLETTWAQLNEKELVDKLQQHAINMGLNVAYVHAPIEHNNEATAVPSQQTELRPNSWQYLANVIEQVKSSLVKRGFFGEEVSAAAADKPKGDILKIIHVPPVAKKNYPQGINPKAKSTWEYVVKKYAKQISLGKDIKGQWAIAFIIFKNACHKSGILPMEHTSAGDGADKEAKQEVKDRQKYNIEGIQTKLNSGHAKGIALQEKTQRALVKEEYVKKDFAAFRLSETGKAGSNLYYISYETKAPLTSTDAKSALALANYLQRQHAFKKDSKYPKYYVHTLDSVTNTSFWVSGKFLISYVNTHVTRDQLDALLGTKGEQEAKVLKLLKKAAQNWDLKNKLTL